MISIFRYGCGLKVYFSSNIVRVSRVSTTRLGQSRATRSCLRFLAGVEGKVHGVMISSGFRSVTGLISNNSPRRYL
jgi:hypothetical protein